MHDLNLALHYSDYVYMIKDGSLRYEGDPDAIMTPENIEDVYGVKSGIADTAYGSFIVPYDSL